MNKKMHYETFFSVKRLNETFCSVKALNETFRRNDTFSEIYKSSEKRIYFLFLQAILASFIQNTLFFYTFMKHLDLKSRLD